MAKIRIIDFDRLKIFKNKIVTLFESHTSDNDIHTSAEDKTKLSQAYTHSTSTHAPTNAEKNIIVGVQKNGSDLSVNSSTRKVNITVPTKISELTNDSGFVKDSDFCKTSIVGDLSDLNTTDKTSIVNAINELKTVIDEINNHTYIVADK